MCNKERSRTVPTGQRLHNSGHVICACEVSWHMLNKETALAQSKVGSSSHIESETCLEVIGSILF